MTKIAIVYHSGFGHTEVQAKAVVSGVTSVNGVSADLFEVGLVTDNPEQLNAYNAIIFGAPTVSAKATTPCH